MTNSWFPLRQWDPAWPLAPCRAWSLLESFSLCPWTACMCILSLKIKTNFKKQDYNKIIGTGLCFETKQYLEPTGLGISNFSRMKRLSFGKCKMSCDLKLLHEEPQAPNQASLSGKCLMVKITLDHKEHYKATCLFLPLFLKWVCVR